MTAPAKSDWQDNPNSETPVKNPGITCSPSLYVEARLKKEDNCSTIAGYCVPERRSGGGKSMVLLSGKTHQFLHS